jgi:SAM-dependent methyltransferase
MQSRNVPVDLLFMAKERINGDPHAMLPLPVVCHRPPMIKNRPRTRLFRWLTSATRPVVCQLNRDRLLLESGVEQACLAKARNRSWIRVDMPDEVCESWDTRSISSLQAVVKETGRKEFYNPVLHSRYRRSRITRPDSIRLDRIRRLIGDYGEGQRGLDIGCNMGYMCHMFQRQGFRMTGVDFDENHLKVAQALNEAYRLDVDFFNCRFEQLESSGGYDIVIMLTVLYHTLNRSKSEAAGMVAKIDGLGPEALFWESGDQPEQEINFIRDNSGLTEYLPLGPTEATGKHRELGVFLRPSTALAELLLGQYKFELMSEFAS